jgi:hypothetical protein
MQGHLLQIGFSFLLKIKVFTNKKQEQIFMS